MNAETEVPLDLELLREVAAICIRREGYLPA